MAISLEIDTESNSEIRPLYDTINVLTSNPAVLYSMQANSDKYKSFTLNHFFDTRRQNLIPRLKMAALGGKFSRVLAIHDEVTNNLVLAEPDTGIVIPITMPNNIIDTVKDMKDKLTGKVNKDVKSLRMLNDFATDNQLLFWSPGGHTIQLMNLEEGSIVKVNFPFGKVNPRFVFT